MKHLEKPIVAMGVLDLAYLAWIAAGVYGESELASLWQSSLSFGLPLPSLQAAGVFVVYLAILACGVALLLRRVALGWLNYVLFPLRVVLVLPTLFPLFVALSYSELSLHPAVLLGLLAGTEAARVVLVHRWSRFAAPGAKAAGAAA